jgi:hypothetical protein
MRGFRKTADFKCSLHATIPFLCQRHSIYVLLLLCKFRNYKQTIRRPKPIFPFSLPSSTAGHYQTQPQAKKSAITVCALFSCHERLSQTAQSNCVVSFRYAWLNNWSNFSSFARCVACACTNFGDLVLTKQKEPCCADCAYS